MKTAAKAGLARRMRTRVRVCGKRGRMGWGFSFLSAGLFATQVPNGRLPIPLKQPDLGARDQRDRERLFPVHAMSKIGLANHADLREAGVAESRNQVLFREEPHLESAPGTMKNQPVKLLALTRLGGVDQHLHPVTIFDPVLMELRKMLPGTNAGAVIARDGTDDKTTRLQHAA